MEKMIITLLLAGLMAGLIQYFVDFKGLPLYQPSTNSSQSFEAEEKPGFWQTIFNFIKAHWQLFGYFTIGIAGAFLTPLINEMTNNRLGGVEVFKKYAECIATQVDGKPICNPIDSWYFLILFGYGIIFGYSSVRIIRSLGTLVLGNLSLKQDEQQKKLEDAQKQIDELKLKVQSLTKPTQGASFAVNEITPNYNDDSEAKDELTVISGFDSCTENTNPKPWKIADSRIGESLSQLRSQINTMAPNRNKLSDGWFGNEAHQSRDSDHNPWVWDSITLKGVVTALDITHDIANNCDCSKLSSSLQSNKDSRIKYVIWNKQIMNSDEIGTAAAWTWRPYNGSNPHDKHIHISVKCDKANYDSKNTWNIEINKTIV